MEVWPAWGSSWLHIYTYIIQTSSLQCREKPLAFWSESRHLCVCASACVCVSAWAPPLTASEDTSHFPDMEQVWNGLIWDHVWSNCHTLCCKWILRHICVCVCVLASMCVCCTWAVEEVFDLQEEQRRRDAGPAVCLAPCRLEPRHGVV